MATQYWYKQWSKERILDKLMSEDSKVEFERWQLEGCPNCGSHRANIKLTTANTKSHSVYTKFWNVSCSTFNCGYQTHHPIINKVRNKY